MQNWSVIGFAPPSKQTSQGRLHTYTHTRDVWAAGLRCHCSKDLRQDWQGRLAGVCTLGNVPEYVAPLSRLADQSQYLSLFTHMIIFFAGLFRNKLIHGPSYELLVWSKFCLCLFFSFSFCCLLRFVQGSDYCLGLRRYLFCLVG